MASLLLLIFFLNVSSSGLESSGVSLVDIGSCSCLILLCSCRRVPAGLKYIFIHLKNSLGEKSGLQAGQFSYWTFSRINSCCCKAAVWKSSRWNSQGRPWNAVQFVLWGVVVFSSNCCLSFSVDGFKPKLKLPCEDAFSEMLPYSW